MTSKVHSWFLISPLTLYWGAWSNSHEHFDGLAATLAEKVILIGPEELLSHLSPTPRWSEGPMSMTHAQVEGAT